MNFLPALQKPRRNFKFSNPLSGIVYNNNSYLKQCHYELQEQLNNQSHPRAPSSNRQLPSRRSGHNHPQDQDLKTSKMNKTAYLARPCKSPQPRKGRTASEWGKPESLVLMAQTNRETDEKYNFKDIDIKIIDAIHSIKDCKTKVLKINLSHYFGVYFKKALLGQLTPDFIKIVEKYLQGLVRKRQLDAPVDTRDHPSDIFKINNKRIFVTRVEELENNGQFKSAQAMVKFYCVPNFEFRESCFRDILHLLSRSLFENFNMNKDKDYVLLDQNGYVLQELCQIKFSTSTLFITQAQHSEKAFARYQNILNDNDMSLQRMSFSEGLKKTFRAKIACGKVDESKSRKLFSDIQKSNSQLKKAQDLLHRKSDKSFRKFSPSKTATNFSPSRAHNHSAQRRPGAKTHLEKQRKISDLQVISISARKRNDQYRKTFDQLVNNNSKYDITFNHLNQNRLLMKVFIDYSLLFKNKSKEQISAILKALGIYEKAESLGWEEYRIVCDISNCKGDKNNIISFINRYMPFNEFGELDRPSLSQSLKFILAGDSNAEVVEEVVWSWLEKNGLVENGVVLRTTLESWYQKNKLAYVMLVSLIFGTNRISTIDMAYQVLL